MRAISLIAPALLVTGLTVAATEVPARATNVSSPVSSRSTDASAPTRACLDNAGPDGGSSVNSQNYEGLDEYGDAAASDFRIGARCVIRVVTVGGSFLNGSGADSFSLVIYRNDRGSGKPGTVVADQDDLAYTYDYQTSTLTLHPEQITLAKGVYWISVVANMSIGEGYWQWETSSTKTRRPDLWENPGGSQGCLTWGTFKRCLDVRPGNLIVTAGS